MKWVILSLLVLISLYFLNFFRLRALPVRDHDDISAVEYHTIMEHGDNTFSPSTFNTKTGFTRITDEVPQMGTHWISVSRLFTPFNPDKPTGEMTWKGQVVGYFYSADKPVDGYMWHYHVDFCLRDGLVPTTKLTPIQCILHGYYWWPFNKWMLHVWTVHNPYGINALTNPLLQ